MKSALTRTMVTALLIAGLTSAFQPRALAAAVITVRVVEDPSITTTVGEDGSFTLRGMPEGGFTVLFSLDSGLLTSVPFAEVKPNQEITITVRIDGSTVIVVEEQRNGIGHGDIEIEGNVTSASPVPSGESVFIVSGRTIIARPGQTAIREGDTARSVVDITVDRKVHLKGIFLAGDDPLRAVLAHEIVLVSSDDDDR
jgi:hypothetical protein